MFPGVKYVCVTSVDTLSGSRYTNGHEENAAIAVGVRGSVMRGAEHVVLGGMFLV